MRPSSRGPEIDVKLSLETSHVQFMTLLSESRIFIGGFLEARVGIESTLGPVTIDFTGFNIL